MRYPFLFVAALLLISSCRNQEEKEASRIKKYFDLSAYFDEEIKKLKAENPKVKKTIWVKNDPETQELFIENWEKELIAFKNSDINKPAWSDSYRTDSLMNKGIGIVRYTTTDSDLSIQFIELEIENGKCINIQILSEEKNTVYSSSHRMNYRKGVGYKLETYQKVNFIDDSGYKIEAVFIK